MQRYSLTLSALLATITATAMAQAPTPSPPPPTPKPASPGPSLELALEAAQTAMATCAANGYKISVIVIDSGGVTRLAMTADGVGPGPVTYSARKANTSLKYGDSSLVVQEKAKTDTTLAAAIAADTTLLARGGGLPLMSKGVLIGAIGVGGAPGGEKDDVCATAAVEKIKGRL